MVLPAEDSLHLKFWGLLRGHDDVRAQREVMAVAVTPALPLLWLILLLPDFSLLVCSLLFDGRRYPDNNDWTCPQETQALNQQEVV